MHFNSKRLQYAGFVVLAMGLAGCAANIPKVSYNGPIPTKSAFTNQAVTLHTSVHGDNFHAGKGCILAFSTKCRDLTMPGKTMVDSYNALLVQGLKNDGALTDPGSSPTYIIQTHMVPSPQHRYMVMEDYNLGHTMKQLIPFYTVLHGHLGDGRYYTMVTHFEDDVQILYRGKVVWHKNIPIVVKTRIYGRSHVFSSGHSIFSKADNVYRTLQSKAITQILAASEHLKTTVQTQHHEPVGAIVPPVS
ncbi:MAG: hypothetical protein M0Z50_00985 [Planctomycetia bacterium]|jgi:hypothetical protein|nr:hypothetical protein [Planctomycetia bacterium]